MGKCPRAGGSWGGTALPLDQVESSDCHRRPICEVVRVSVVQIDRKSC